MKNLLSIKVKARGFTLIELLVVISIIGLLSSIVLVGLRAVRNKAKDVQVKADMHSIGIALESYAAENNEFFPKSYNCTTIPAICSGGYEKLTVIDGTDLNSDTVDTLIAGGYMNKFPVNKNFGTDPYKYYLYKSGTGETSYTLMGKLVSDPGWYTFDHPAGFNGYRVSVGGIVGTASLLPNGDFSIPQQMNVTPAGTLHYLAINDDMVTTNYISVGGSTQKTDVFSFPDSPADVQKVTGIVLSAYGKRAGSGTVQIAYSIDSGSTWSTNIPAFTNTAAWKTGTYTGLTYTKAQINDIRVRCVGYDASSGVEYVYSLKMDITYIPVP